MSYKAAIAAALLAAASAPASAQVTGGSLDIEWGGPSDFEDLGSTTYRGALEYSITREVAVSVDLSSYKFNNVSTEAASLTVHGVYHLDDTASLGAFVGIDRRNDVNNTLYGIEGGSEFMGGSVEAYLGRLDANEQVTLLGGKGEYGFSNGFGAIASLDYNSVAGGPSVTRVAVGGQYEMNNGPTFFAELGNTDVSLGDTSASDIFIGLGVSVAIGAGRGTTFDARSSFETTPGF